MAKKVTISIICDVVSLAGHHIVPKPLFDVAEKNLKKTTDESGTLRRMGEFEPARLSAEEMEYTTIQQVLSKLKITRWELFVLPF